MARQADVFNIITERLAVGLSSYHGVTAGPYVVSMSIEYSSGGSCLLLGMTQVAGIATLGASALANGYILEGDRMITFGGPASFFLAATGATAIVEVIKSLGSSGGG